MANSFLEKLQENLEFIGGNLLIFSITSGIWRFASNLVSPFYALYVLELEGNYFSIGLIGFVGGAFGIIPSLIGGHLADTGSRKNIVSVLSICAGPINLINAFAPDWKYLLLATSLNSLLMGLRSPAFSAILADSIRPKNRGKGYGLWSSLPNLPGLISPAIGGWLISQIGLLKAMRLGYVSLTIAATTAGVIRFFFLRDTFQGEEKAVKLKESLNSLFTMTKHLPTSLKVLLVVNGIVIFGWLIQTQYQVTYAKEVIGLTAFQWGVLTTLTNVIRNVMLPFLGNLVDNIGRKATLLGSSMLIPVVNFIFIFSTGFYPTLFALVIRSVAGGLRGTSLSAFRADLSPKEKRGKISSIFEVVARPSRMAGPLLGGYFYANFTKSTPFFAEASLTLGLLPIILFLLNEPKEKKK